MDMSHMDNEATCPMIMVFHGGHCERILWQSWVVSTHGEFVLSCLAFIAMGFLYESLKSLRQYLFQQATRKATDRINLELKFKKKHDHDTSASKAHSSTIALTNIGVKPTIRRAHITGTTHIISALLFFIQIIISYLLMLVIMNYNYWLCLSVVLGLGLGYFIFGLNQHDAYDSDCCH